MARLDKLLNDPVYNPDEGIVRKITELHEAIGKKLSFIPTPRLVWNRSLQSRLGQYRGTIHTKREYAEIELCYKEDIDSLTETLLHEWAHHLQYTCSSYRQHGAEFWSIYGQLLLLVTGSLHLQKPCPHALGHEDIANKLK